MRGSHASHADRQTCQTGQSRVVAGLDHAFQLGWLWNDECGVGGAEVGDMESFTACKNGSILEMRQPRGVPNLAGPAGRFDPLKTNLSIFKTRRPSIAPIHLRGSPVMHVKTVSEADTMEMTPTGHHYLCDFKLQPRVDRRSFPGL